MKIVNDALNLQLAIIFGDKENLEIVKRLKNVLGNWVLGYR